MPFTPINELIALAIFGILFAIVVIVLSKFSD